MKLQEQGKIAVKRDTGSYLSLLKVIVAPAEIVPALF